VTCTANVTYTGSALTPCTVSITGAGGLSTTPTASYSNNTNAGTGTGSYTYAGDSNHNGSTGSTDFTIDKASSNTTVSCTASVVYTGSAQTPCTVSVTGAGGLSSAPTPTYSSNTNVGTATASYSFTGDSNHTSSSNSTTFSITKATSTTTVTCTDPVTYTGSALTPCTVSVTGAGGLSSTPTATYSNNTNPGTGTGSYTFAGDSNHSGSSDSTTFTIDQPYDLTVGGTGRGLIGDGTCLYTATIASGTNAGAIEKRCSTTWNASYTATVADKPQVMTYIPGVGGVTVSKIVTAHTDGTITNVRASDLTSAVTAATSSAGGGGVAYDGTYIWSTVTTGWVYKTTRAGAFVSRYLTSPVREASDVWYFGGYVWVGGPDQITVLDPSDSSVVQTIGKPGDALCDDGTYLWAVDSANDRIRKINSSGTIVLNQATTGNAPGRCHYYNGYIYLSRTSDSIISKLSATDGSLVTSFGPTITGKGTLSGPGQMDDVGGHMWVKNGNGHLIRFD